MACLVDTRKQVLHFDPKQKAGSGSTISVSVFKVKNIFILINYTSCRRILEYFDNISCRKKRSLLHKKIWNPRYDSRLHLLMRFHLWSSGYNRAPLSSHCWNYFIVMGTSWKRLLWFSSSEGSQDFLELTPPAERITLFYSGQCAVKTSILVVLWIFAGCSGF